MVGTKNPFICDRRVYSFKGSWKSPNNDIKETIYYYVSSKPTFKVTYQNGREELQQSLDITVFGEHAFCVNDIITLQTGETYRIGGIANTYFEPNIAIRDMVKQRIENQVLVLE